MSNTKVLVTALLTYLLVCGAGGVAYYYYSMMAPPPPGVETEVTPPPDEKSPPPGEKPEEPKSPEEAAKEAEARRNKEIERQQAKERAAVRDRKMTILEAGMLKQKNGSFTIYSYPKPEQPRSGLYLRPSVAVGHKSRLQYELYYYYNISDGQGTAWIFGDRLTIKAGGQHYEFVLNPEKRQKALAPDAEWLSERYTGIADETWQNALRAVVAAGYGTMTYYQEGGKSITAEFSGDAYRQVKDMLALYDLTFEQSNDEAEE